MIITASTISKLTRLEITINCYYDIIIYNESLTTLLEDRSTISNYAHY